MGDILFLAHRIPYPPDKGDKIRSWNILKYIAGRANVHLGAFVDDPRDMAHAARLESVCRSVKLIQFETGDRWKRAFSGWWRDMPISVALYEDREMRRWVRDRIKTCDIDRIFVFSGQMAPYALRHSAENRHIVMDFVDVDSDKFAQYASESRWPKSALYAREARLLEAFEKQVARHADLSLFVSDAEAAMFKRGAGSSAHSVEALHNGVDLNYFSASAKYEPMSLAGHPALVFTGAMDYRPNVDAVCWFASTVLPRVRAVHPDATFHIVGGKPADAVRALGRLPGVTVTGRVPDVRPYLAAADIAVAPVRIARGVQNKVLEAMAMSRPIVTTSAAFSGIDAEPGRDLIVRDSAEDFAEAVNAVVSDDTLSASLGGNARRCVEQRYSWAAQLHKLDHVLGLANEKDVAA